MVGAGDNLEDVSYRDLEFDEIPLIVTVNRSESIEGISQVRDGTLAYCEAPQQAMDLARELGALTW